MDKSPIIIAGAGIAGLAAALALGDRDVLILEKANKFSPIGAGLQLGPNAVRALQKLGAWDAVEPITSSAPEIHMWDAISGQSLKRLPLGKTFEKRFGAPYRLAHRGELHEALLSIIRQRPNIQVKLSTESLSAKNDGGMVALETNQTQYRAQALIAADGVHSNLRQSLFQTSGVIDSGETYHRTMLKGFSGDGIDFDCVNLWMHPQAHVVHYRVGRQGNLNSVAIVPRSANLEQHFVHATPRLKSVLALMQGHVTQWQSYSAPRLSTWTQGGILLIGDAAHGALPYLAQGAAMSLEDAASLKAALKVKSDIHTAFSDTEKSRMARTRRLQNESINAGELYHMSGIKRHFRNLVIKSTPNNAILSRLAWIYDHA